MSCQSHWSLIVTFLGDPPCGHLIQETDGVAALWIGNHLSKCAARCFGDVNQTQNRLILIGVRQ